MSDTPSFAGFPEETFRFLRGISEKNDKAWLDAHRDDYERGYVEPARAFVAALGPRLRALCATIRFEPKVNGSIFRINRDVRFSKDKTPYKDHLDLWFWHGEKRGWDTPGFFFRLTPKALMIGAGMHQLGKPLLEAYREAVVAPASGRALVKAIDAVKAAGPYSLGGATRKTVPRGFDPEHERAALLLHEGLWADATVDVAVARTPKLVDTCARCFEAVWPLGRWLLKHVVEPAK